MTAETSTTNKKESYKFGESNCNHKYMYMHVLTAKPLLAFLELLTSLELAHTWILYYIVYIPRIGMSLEVHIGLLHVLYRTYLYSSFS